MHHHRIPDPQGDAASHGARDDHVQRRVLLELVTAPPAAGDRLAALARALGEPNDEVAQAVEALVDAGLAVRDVQTIRASKAALRFDALWPI
jgi:hypothetical protein